jgi:hypothetical protein
MNIPRFSHDRADDLIAAGAALCQELQDILDEGLEAAGESDPTAGTALAHMQALIADWDSAANAYLNDAPETTPMTKTAFKAKDLVRFHPVIGGNHDGKLYRISALTTLGHGERAAFLEGKSGCVSLRALSTPTKGFIDPDSPQTAKRI